MGKRTVEILRREKMEMTLPTLVELFAATKQTEGKSPKTVTCYKLMIGRFIKFLGDTATIRDLSLTNARAFVAHLQGQKTRYQDHPLIPVQEGGLSVHTIHGYVRAIKAFGSWLAEEGFTAVNKFVRLKRPKLPQTMVETLTDGEIDMIFKIINPKCFLGARMELICLLLLDTGVRASELTGLTVNRTFVRENYLKVIGKGGKERMVPFGNTTKKALLRYLVTWRPEPIEGDMLILSVKGKPLTQNALSHMIKRLGVRASVPRLHPYLFRHTFAVRYLMNGGDIMTLKLILGHVDLSTTEMYLHLAQSHFQIQSNKFSPVDRLR